MRNLLAKLRAEGPPPLRSSPRGDTLIVTNLDVWPLDRTNVSHVSRSCPNTSALRPVGASASRISHLQRFKGQGRVFLPRSRYVQPTNVFDIDPKEETLCKGLASHRKRAACRSRSDRSLGSMRAPWQRANASPRPGTIAKPVGSEGHLASDPRGRGCPVLVLVGTRYPCAR